jgi:adenylosuccinate synthase
VYPSRLINVIDTPAMWTGSHPQLVDGRGTVAIVSHQIGMTRPCGWERIPVCVAYDIDGRRVDELPMTETEFHHAAPVYAYFDGWSDDIRDARTLDDLPENAQTYLKSLEDLSGAPISAIGVGPGREETVVIRPLLGG